jgi:hypothetical protein
VKDATYLQAVHHAERVEVHAGVGEGVLAAEVDGEVEAQADALCVVVVVVVVVVVEVVVVVDEELQVCENYVGAGPKNITRCITGSSVAK